MKMKLLKVALILSLLLFGAQIPAVEASTLDGETTVNLNVRSKPSTTGAVITTLPKGTKVKYGTYNQSWHKVYLNSRTYYASAPYIKRIVSSPTTIKTQAASSTGETTVNLNVRTKPSTTGTVVKTLPKGTKVKYGPYNKTWHKVYLNNRTYYASAAYIKQIVSSPTTVTTQETSSTGETTVNLNVRTKPSTTGTVVKTLPKGTKVKYGPYNKSWHKVYLNNRTYYASAAYIKQIVSSPTATKPVETKIQGYANRNINLFGKTSQSSAVLLVLPQYTAVTYSTYNSSWSNVFVGSKTYFTPTSWLTAGKAPSAPAASPQGKVYINTPGDVLNVRATASASSTILGKLAHGTQVDHYGSSNGFYKIKYNNRDGYISTAYASASKPSASSGAVIILDAGHGGTDPGAVRSSLYEKTVVLDVTKRTEAYLRSKYGYEVRLTRSTDVYLTLNQRVQAARNLRGDLFVSLHTNAATTSAANGVETFYSTSSAHSAKSRVLATNIQSNLMGEMSGMRNRGVKTANYYVITYNTMPSALVELGFISSPQDIVHLRSEASRQRMAIGVAEGIAQYVRAYH
ncbi:cell wall hydrolase [Exiguobacterium sp. SH3S2]|uniref:N-acetylmuramoyl-L-alanine amidase n=1 Tax=unclassified Exiguobacterium TaxID=2644629 RepID=UPI001039ADB1|nr:MULTISPECIES: N-acetylmuramoyl-L-alanine amidase [unclassified Exiguobacterium]TCI48877.1 cell wall hydrolase [Exiguobacterium sp. SH3S3]TCI63741.1 cell wall hydrolase [Exiguobacterium sp. SH3S2]